ncbi:MAG: hypothetical protein AB7F53_04705 [Nitrososphaeraceae archaeon]
MKFKLRSGQQLQTTLNSRIPQSDPFYRIIIIYIKFYLTIVDHLTELNSSILMSDHYTCNP